MKTNFAVLFSPNEANGQTATQFPACGFIANSTLEPCAKNVQFRFRHDALQSEHRSEEHTSELQSRLHLVCRLLLEKKKNINHGIREAIRMSNLGLYGN